MSEASLTSYEEVPYQSKPLYPTHPDCLATLATLMGMAPASVDRCRVLELGCATGGNLIPMAASLPGSRFVGIDLSPRQVAVGQEVIQRLGLDNIELRPLSILDVGDDFGQFDYVICHGVYSWVPPPVQDKILDVCKRHMAPQGIAYISYNTYPGWHMRGLVRDAMGFHVRQFADPETRVQQARAFLTFLSRAVPEQDSTYARILREEAETLSGHADYYVFHEHLEDANHPLYFHEFAARTAAKGLQYVGEAWYHHTLTDLPQEIQETLQAISSDLIRLEQYLDLLRNKTFRRTVLCHDGVALTREQKPQVMMGLYMSGLARPEPEGTGGEGGVEAFRGEGRTISTNIPVVKAALRILYDVWPRPLAFAELWDAVRGRLGEGLGGGHGPEILAATLLDCYLSRLVALHVHRMRFTVEVSDRPLVSALARLQAREGNAVVNQRHRLVLLNDLDRLVLGCLDGTRDRAAVLEAVVQVATAGGLTIETPDGLPPSPEALRETLGREVAESLRGLAGSALLVA
jgi:methyltransferase-like protein/cyclopropane fatty-acyl-phospholipid synthase-like methyltransferase